MPTHYFTCPACSGHHFGRDIGPDLQPLDTVRCHDENRTGCDWRGPLVHVFRAAPNDFMTTEQKLEALQALCPTTVRMRSLTDWYVCATGRECREGRMLSGRYGNGRTPQEAVDDDWEKISRHPCVVITAPDYTRRCVRWNGFMWASVEESK